MKKLILPLIVVLMMVILSYVLFLNKVTLMQISSGAFQNNQKIPSIYTCDGSNISPPLNFSGIPQETKSVVLIVDDPDAPRGDWVHWLVWNMAPDIKGIVENGSPSRAVQGTTDFGRPGYGGPCPPSGAHRYQFKLYALDTILNLPSTARKKELENAIAGHILDKASLIGLYQRQ